MKACATATKSTLYCERLLAKCLTVLGRKCTRYCSTPDVMLASNMFETALLQLWYSISFHPILGHRQHLQCRCRLALPARGGHHHIRPYQLSSCYRRILISKNKLGRPTLSFEESLQLLQLRILGNRLMSLCALYMQQISTWQCRESPHASPARISFNFCCTDRLRFSRVAASVRA